jgi:hypothetical protein
MKTSLGAKILAQPTPVWVIGSYDQDGRPNAMTAAWCGVCCSKPPCLTVSIQPQRHSFAGIMQRKAFTVNIGSCDQAEIVDYFGMASGKTEDKFQKTGMTPVKGEMVDQSLCLQPGNQGLSPDRRLFGSGIQSWQGLSAILSGAVSRSRPCSMNVNGLDHEPVFHLLHPRSPQGAQTNLPEMRSQPGRARGQKKPNRALFALRSGDSAEEDPFMFVTTCGGTQTHCLRHSGDLDDRGLGGDVDLTDSQPGEPRNRFLVDTSILCV